MFFSVIHRSISSSYQPSNTTTLGRFSKSTNRLVATQSLNTDSPDYRSNSQTLPRTLEHKPLHSSTINVSVINTVQKPLANTGPAKPARSYKALNRSKSFNVHGLNGTDDPSPIFIEKINGNRYTTSNMYKSNPHLNDQQLGSQLKSPSIVNLISRSTRDLSNVGTSPSNGYHIEKRYSSTSASNGVDKKHMFLKDLHEKSPELFKVINEEPLTHSYKVREREAFVRNKSPMTINKDTASIVRRGSSSTEDYAETFNTTHHSTDPSRPGVTNTTETISRKTIPSPDGRGQRIVESREVRSTTHNRFRGSEPLKYIDTVDRSRRSGSRNGVAVIDIKRY